MQELLIEKIRTDGGVQSRERISDEYVDELAELIKAGKKLPPVDVYNDGTDIWMSDGFHRIHAHVKANKRTIRCDVKKGTKTDAMWASCAANQNHGLRRTNADKRYAVEMALKINYRKSDRAIADHVGVSDTFVSGLRSHVPTVGTCERIGKDGKTYKVPPPPGTPKPTKDANSQEDKPFDKGQGRPKKIPPPPSGETGVGGGQSTSASGTTADMVGSKINPHPSPLPSPPQADLRQGEGEEREGKTPPPPPPQPKERPDEVGKTIPDHLWPLWDRGDEIAQMASTVTRISNQIREMHDEGDLVILDGNGQAIVAALETAKQALKANIPHAVCPYCKGTLSQHCRFCKGRGIIGEFQYKHVPKELKSCMHL